MDLISFFILCVIVGLAIWAINTYLPLPQPIKTLILVAGIVVLVVVLLQALGILNAHVMIPQIRR